MRIKSALAGLAVMAAATTSTVIITAPTSSAETLEWRDIMSFPSYQPHALQNCKDRGYDDVTYGPAYDYQCRSVSGGYRLWELLPPY